MTETSSSMSETTAETLAFLRSRADELGTNLPPLGKTPRRWPRMLQAPQGPPGELGSTPWAFLKAVLRAAKFSIVLQSITLTINAIISAMLPVVIGFGIDAAIDHGLSAELWKWVGIFLGMVLVMALTDGVNQMLEIANWLQGALGSSRTVAHRISRAGRAAKQDKPAGDVVTAILADSDHIGTLVIFTSEAIASMLAFGVVLYVMLNMSVPLGLVIVIGFPLTVIAVTFLVKPIQTKLAIHREEQGKLTTISTDAVTGLRVLRGIGGEDYYNVRYKEQSTRVKDAAIRVAGNQAALAVLRSSVPMFFMAVVVGYGALLVFDGKLTAGELFAFAGLTAYLRRPINIAAWVAQLGTRGWIAAKKLSEFHSLEPQVDDSQADLALAPDNYGSLPLTDVETGVTVEPAKLTALVAQSPDVSAAVAKRMARVDDADEARLGDISLRHLPLDVVRKEIVLSEADAQLFRGTLHSGLRASKAEDPPTRGVTELVYREHLEEAARREGMLFRADRVPADDRLAESMHIADAHDVLDSLEGGMAGWLTERGRNLSGGQRQRVALARSVYADPSVLIAIEPTSAVDSHTEERISSRLSKERADKTTVVVTASPLWLEKCDEIIVLDGDGKEVTRGTHEQLKAAAAAGDPGALLYRTIVQREAGEINEASGR